MKERFKQLPEPLQQQVIRRFAIAIVFVLLFFITLFGFWDVYLFLPCPRTRDGVSLKSSRRLSKEVDNL